jgi:hypothetical protein
MGRTTKPRPQRSPTGGQASSYINVCDDHLAVPRFRGLRREKHVANTNSAAHVRVIEETPAYWRVVFDYPPFNIVDASIFEALQDLLARMNDSPSLRVVVFESANPEFYLAHFDLTGKIGNIMTAVGGFGPPDPDGYVRASHQVPGGQHREDPRLCPGPEQRVRPRLRQASAERLALEVATIRSDCLQGHGCERTDRTEKIPGQS